MTVFSLTGYIVSLCPSQLYAPAGTLPENRRTQRGITLKIPGDNASLPVRSGGHFFRAVCEWWCTSIKFSLGYIHLPEIE